jgi:hydroxymethylpyrimidine kinase/phosphomethylpyrimidine kinase
VIVASIGTTDPWNAAGLGLDVLALAECGVHPVTVVAGVTAQDRNGIAARHAVPPDVVVAQLHALRDAEIAAYRIGALLDVATLDVVGAHVAAAGVPAVYDPVLSASGGGDFAGPAFARAMLERLVPHVRLLTPNLDEAARLTGMPAIENVDAMEAAGRALCALGTHAVLVKGGHLAGAAVDVLVVGDATTVFESPRLPGSLRGTGCLLACAVAARLAHGDSLAEAVAFGRAFVREKFATARRVGGMNLAY